MKLRPPPERGRTGVATEHAEPFYRPGGRFPPAVLPGFLVVGVFLVWAGKDAGFPPTVWYPGGLFLLALLVTVVVARPETLAQASRVSLAAAALLAASTVWAYLSITWADVKGDAWDGANRYLVYTVVFALFAMLPWTPRLAAGLLGLYTAGLAVVGAVAVQQAATGDASSIAEGRLIEPAGYANANAGLFLAAAGISLVLASRAWVPVLVRGLLLAASGVAAEIAVLAQSRASLFAVPFALLVLLAVVPGRLRSLVHGVPVALALLAARRPLLDVYEAALDGRPQSALPAARNAIALSAAALLVVGVVIALADRRLPLRSPRLGRAAATAAAVACAGLAVGLVLVTVGNPGPRIGDAWREFTAGQTRETGSSHLTGVGLGSNRYDFWRVGFNSFVESPLVGNGADNFAVDYLRERRSPEEPLYPHSLEIMVLSETGVVGAVLFAGFLLAALLAAVRARRRGGLILKGVWGAAIVGVAYWAAHGSVDWFWEFPGLTAPALAWLALVGALQREPVHATPSSRRFGSGRRLAVATLAVIAVAGAGASLTFPWLAEREVEFAKDTWRTDGPAALESLARARRLNVLSDRPDVVAGVISLELGEREHARQAFRRALGRNPWNWFAHVELAALDAQEGLRDRALGHLREARRLNPREPTVDLLLGQVSRNERVSIDEIHRLLLTRLEARST